MDIFNEQERKIKCIDKYDTSPYGCEYELLEVGKEYTVTDIYVYDYFTYIVLKEFPDKEFNSVLFEEIEESEGIIMAKSRAEVVEEHIEGCFKGVKDGKKQSQEDSLAFISQSLVDLNFTLALMYDEMMKEREGEHE